jgi:hypothetical protein
MRLYAVTTLYFSAACFWAVGPNDAVNVLLAQAQSPKTSPPSVKLYTDEEIRKLAKYDIDKASEGGKGLFDIPCLDVVPNGESYARAKVFKALNLDDTRIKEFRHSEMDHVVFLTWQVSPSYAISCMSATNDPDNGGVALTHPNRKVYGIRLVKRSK